MKKINEIMGEKSVIKSALSQQTKRFLTNCALRAHELDKSLSVQEYYQLFLKRLKASYFHSKYKKEFFSKGIIE